MKARTYKKSIYIVLMIIICFSCTKEKRSELIKQEVIREDSPIENITGALKENESKYIINKRTGKIHSYTHGVKIVSDRYQLETNEDIDKILENENYDICLNCYAGLKLNLDKYRTNDKNMSNDEVDITNKEVNLIKQYMNMYEFGKLDTETQKFLICIFEVGNWYVNNVYTQLGGQKTAREVDDIAEVEASESAYNKWRNYLALYGNRYTFNENKKILPVIYDNGKSSDMVLYKCDLFKNAGYGKGNNIYTKSGMVTLQNSEKEEIDKEWKNYCVVDDSSKFAAAVYYHYINKEILKDEKQDDKIAYGIDLWETSSTDFSKLNNFTKKILSTKRFKLIMWDDINDEISLSKSQIKEHKLKVGDLLYRNGTVEFYIGKNKVVNWGQVHKEYYIQKEIYYDGANIFTYDIKDNYLQYMSFIRFEGGQ